MQNILVYLIFILTYVLIASRRLSILPIGRPAGALFGATLMVAAGALTPEQSYRSIDHNTILLLFSMMILSIYLERAGFFILTARKIGKICNTPWKMLISVVLSSGFLSAFLMNDTICIFMTPIVVSICRTYGLPFGPFLIALATSANIGSAASLVGNPQNMIIGSLSSFNFGRFILFAAPPALLGLLINIVLLRLIYRKEIPSAFASMPDPDDNGNGNGKMRLALATVLCVISGFFAGWHLAYTSLAGVMFLIIADREEPSEIFARIDWSILVFFCCLFIVVQGLNLTGIVEKAWTASESWLRFSRPAGLFFFTALMTAGSNIVSNVPMVMLTGPLIGNLGPAEAGWVLLAFITTVAGNLTLIGSVANIIVAEGAKKYYTLNFFEYLRFGLISTITVLTAGVGLIYLMMI